mmetsp:Transcript_31484/g.57672  ORF Transcript_31484/g.57672 Transcript_31484/m.57672 type:complete len:91 (-) Transcript_31484:905-1177(-)
MHTLCLLERPAHMGTPALIRSSTFLQCSTPEYELHHDRSPPYLNCIKWRGALHDDILQAPLAHCSTVSNDVTCILQNATTAGNDASTLPR